MRLNLFLTTALAFAYVAALPSSLDGPQLRKRQIPPSIIALVNSIVNPKGGKVSTPAGAVPKKVELTARTKAEGAKTIKMRYGPYKVPNMKSKNLLNEGGSLWNYGDTEVPKPCDMCTILGMNAGLEYADGANANIDTGMWLHHMVLVNIGPGRSDATCDWLPISAPHMIAGSLPGNSERIFSSGNERTKVIFPTWNKNNVGYKLKTTDKFALIVDLMNENMADKVVYLTMTYDIVPGHPANYDDIKPVWFDVAQCLTSEWPAPYDKGNYTVPSMMWKANFEGDIIVAIGHLHDGGQRVTLDVDGKRVCTSEASYGDTPEYVQKAPMGHPNSATEHLSRMTACVDDKMAVKKLERGQTWKLRAEYDYDKNKGVLHENGKQGNVMGIAIMYVRLKK